MEQDTKNNNIYLPSDDDFYHRAPDCELLFKEKNKKVNPIEKSDADSASEYAFYREDPLPPGHNTDYDVYVMDVKLPGSKSSNFQSVKDILVQDGDTISIKVSNINPPDEECKKYLEKIKTDEKTYANKIGLKEESRGTLPVRLACMDAAELPHFARICSVEGLRNKKVETATYDEIEKNDSYVASRYKCYMDNSVQIKNTYMDDKIKDDCIFYDYSRDMKGSNEELKFMMYEDGKRHQCFDLDGQRYVLLAEPKECNEYKTPDKIADAGLARDTIMNAINKATEMRIMINGSTISRNGNTVKTMLNVDPFDPGIVNRAKIFIESIIDNEQIYKTTTVNSDDGISEFMCTGFKNPGLDPYDRAISAVYVKIEGNWYNLNKMVIANTEYTEINPILGNPTTDNQNNYMSRAFDSDSYEYYRDRWVDSIYNDSSQYDDRAKIQREIFKGHNGKSLNTKLMQEWTVTIGDVTLFVPPTSIRCITQSKTDRMPVVRAKGSLTKNATKTQRILEMDLYFSGNDGINGYKFKTNTRTDGKGIEKIYYMNGLRALYAQFRICPFLPIENFYINTVLNIDAVTMLNFSAETVPGFPQLIKATVQFTEFEYRIYMPEIPWDDDDENGLRNYFSKQIHYPLLRFYYQRLLENGENLKNINFLSETYIQSTFGDKTCLIPMSFGNSGIKFYIPNKEHLDKLKQVKIERLKNAATIGNITKKDLEFAKDLSKIKNEINYANTDKDSKIAALNQFINCTPYYETDDSKFYLCRQQEMTDSLYTNNLEVYKFTNVDGKIKVTRDDETEEIKNQILERLDSIASDYKECLINAQNQSETNLCTDVHHTDFSFIQESENYCTASYNIEANVNIPYITKEEQKSMKSLATAQGDFSADEVFKDGKIIIPISINLPYINGDFDGFHPNYGFKIGNKAEPEFKIDNSKDMSFLTFMEAAANAEGINGNEEANEYKASIDRVNSGTIKFEPYNAEEEFIIESMHFSTSNTFSQITLQETNGYAPQYMGGTDSQIDITMHTQSERAALAMANLPSISANFAREYRIVLTSWPLKIESEITKLFGITDVMVEAVEVDTVPSYPHLYSIHMKLTSVDRSLRNREALLRKDLQNYHKLTGKAIKESNTYTYDKINTFIAQAELYPDLELPTLKELSEAGFNFVKYRDITGEKINTNRVYPDPDFYFMYSHVLMSEILREAILKTQGSKAAKWKFEDQLGQKIEGDLFEDMGRWKMSYAFGNDPYSRIETDFDNRIDRAAARTIVDFSNSDDPERDELWQVNEDIKVAFCEKRIANKINDKIKNINLEYKTPNALDLYGSIVDTVAKSRNVSSDSIRLDANLSKMLTKVYTDFVKGKYVITDEMKSQEYGKDILTDADKIAIGDLLNQVSTAEKQHEEKADGAYEKIAKVQQEIKDDIDKILWSPIEENTNINQYVNDIINRFNRNDAESQTNINVDQWLEAAADTICPNTNDDFVDSLKNRSKNAGWRHKDICRFKVDGIWYELSSEEYSEYSKSNLHNDTTGYSEHLDATNQEYFVGSNGKEYPTWKKIRNDITEFSIYNIRFYTSDELENRFGYYGIVDAEKDTARHGNLYLADPYYRNEPEEKIHEYVIKCITDINFAKTAFMRICLLYYKTLLDYDILPSFSYDVCRESLNDKERLLKVIKRMEELKAQEAAKEKTTANKAKEKASQSDRFSNSKVDNKQEEKKSEQKKEDNQTANSSTTAEANQNTNVSNSNSANTDKSTEQSNKQTDSSDNAKTEVFSGLNTSSLSAEEMQQAVNKYVSLFQQNRIRLDSGRMFVIILMGILDGSEEFKKTLLSRDYKTLDSLSQKAYNEDSVYDPNAIDYGKKLVRFIKALAGENIISSKDISGINQFDADKVNLEMQSRINIAAAADNPELYMKHSYYDMIVNDCRGRMMRAFPTFYMIIIDEGRRIGKWKLHDNFYNLNSIASISIAKSRKIPTDTAEIIMTNFFNTYSTEDEDLNMSYTYNIRDAVKSIFNPLFDGEDYAAREDQRRTDAMAPERFRLRTGARIHIRMGYGGDATALPILFNGVIAELETADVVKVVAQGDGSELSKPILENKQAYEMLGADKTIDTKSIGENSVTPKQIISILLNYQGGALNKWLYEKGLTDIGNLFGEPHNPLGIYHFGNPHAFYAGSRETIQNVFEMGPLKNGERYVEYPSAEEAVKALKEELETEETTFTEDTCSKAANILENIGKGALAGTMSGAAIGTFLGPFGAGAGAAMGAVAGTVGAVAGMVLPKVGEPIVDYVDSNLNFFRDRYKDIKDGKLDDVPRINFQLYGKTVWDILHICRSIDPDWYTAVLPFNMRSTVFFGRANDYYAYDYVKDEEKGVWYEKRKPFQQYHIYTSYSDIINNGIIVSSKDIKTCASGIYEVQGSLGSSIQKKTDTVWVDAMIFPENQKMMYVDTKLYGEASRKLAALSDIINYFTAGITQGDHLGGIISPDRAADEDGDVRNHHAMAKKMAISALKSQMKEMYQGQITIIGDPSVKPYDSISIYDNYHGICGETHVRDVVNIFSAEDGYKTVITPDLIVRTIGAGGEDQVRKSGYVGIALATAVGFGLYVWLLRDKTLNLIAKSAEIIKDAKYDLGVIKNALSSSEIAKQSRIASKISRTAKNLKDAAKASKYLRYLVGGYGSKITGKVASTAVGKVAGKVVASAGARLIGRAIGGAIGGIAGVGAGFFGGFGVGAGPGGLAGLAAGMAIGEAATVLILGNLDKVFSATENFRTLLVFPLRKYGRPMVGGIEGNSGIVYGAPNFDNENNNLIFNDVFNALPEFFSFDPYSEDKTTGQVIAREVFGDTFISVVNQNKKNLLDLTEDGKKRLELQNELENSYIDLFRKAYFNPLKPRMKSHNKARATYGINGDTEQEINTNPNLDSMVLVQDDPQLKWVKKIGFFKIPALESNFNGSLNSSIKPINIKVPNGGNKTIAINAIVDKNNVIDVPLLHNYAHGLLREIIRATFYNLPGMDQQRDPAKWYEDNKDCSLVLASALKINSKDGYENTGCQFILKATNEKTYKALHDGMKEIHNKIYSTASKNEAVKYDVMNIKPNINENWDFSSNEGNLYVIAYPPESTG